jgi:hypothetical protein
MAIPVVNILVSDGGLYDRSIIQLSIKRKYDEREESGNEIILIKYGNRRDFQVCSAYQVSFKQGYVMLSAAGTGVMYDIRITNTEWLNALIKLKSKETFLHWITKIKIKEVIA